MKGSYVFYTYIVRKQVMNSHVLGSETAPRYEPNASGSG